MASYDEKLSGLIDKPCLYSTICATRVDAETGEAIEPLYDEAGTYCEVIARQMEAFRTKEYPTDDLMRYFCLPNSPQTETSIKSKIRSAHVTVEAVGKNLYGKLKLDMTANKHNLSRHKYPAVQTPRPSRPGIEPRSAW